MKTSSYHPSFNGLAKQAMQALGLRMSKGSVENKVSRFLFNYRVPLTLPLGHPQVNLCLEDSYVQS